MEGPGLGQGMGNYTPGIGLRPKHLDHGKLVEAVMKDKRRKAQHTLWTTGRGGTLTPWSQSKVWALAKAWAATHPESDYGRNTWIKGLVEAVTKDKRRKARPTEEAIGKLIAKIEADPSWFPGKVHGILGGAPQQIPRLNKATPEARWRGRRAEENPRTRARSLATRRPR